MSLGVGQLRHIQGVQTIHVFVLQDAVQDQMLVDVRGEGQLHQNAVNLGV